MGDENTTLAVHLALVADDKENDIAYNSEPKIPDLAPACDVFATIPTSICSGYILQC